MVRLRGSDQSTGSQHTPVILKHPKIFPSLVNYFAHCRGVFVSAEKLVDGDKEVGQVLSWLQVVNMVIMRVDNSHLTKERVPGMFEFTMDGMQV